jgi:hypothetical protein
VLIAVGGTVAVYLSLPVCVDFIAKKRSVYIILIVSRPKRKKRLALVFPSESQA